MILDKIKEMCSFVDVDKLDDVCKGYKVFQTRGDVFVVDRGLKHVLLYTQGYYVLVVDTDGLSSVTDTAGNVVAYYNGSLQAEPVLTVAKVLNAKDSSVLKAVALYEAVLTNYDPYLSEYYDETLKICHSYILEHSSFSETRGVQCAKTFVDKIVDRVEF